MWKALTEQNRDREGAAAQEMTGAEPGRFLTGAVRITRRRTCDVTLDHEAESRTERPPRVAFPLCG